jgi:hypothetical protein
MDPLYDRRQVMPQAEFDAVHYFVNTAGRAPAPPPRLGLYLDSGLGEPALAVRLGELLDGLLGLSARTVEVPMRLAAGAYALVDRPAAGTATWSGDTLGMLVEALLTWRLEMLDVLIYGPGDRRLTLEVRARPGNPRAALGISVTPSANLWPVSATDAMADLLLGLVRSWSSWLELRTAAVVYDCVGLASTPWELWYGVNETTMLPATREHTRGYYWANLLTAGHLAAYGGTTESGIAELRRRAQALGLVVEPVVDPDGGTVKDAVVVRAPGPITAFDDDRLAAMKTLLGPVLLNRPYRFYSGYPLRIIRDPGTAFRQVPPSEPYPRVT